MRNSTPNRATARKIAIARREDTAAQQNLRAMRVPLRAAVKPASSNQGSLRQMADDRMTRL
jgi:hypothetical protein